MVLPMRAHGAMATLGDDVRHRLRDEREVVIRIGTLPADARLRDERAPREPPALLRVLPHVALAEPVLDVPPRRTRDYQRGRVRRTRLAEELRAIGVHRQFAERVLPARLTIHDEAEVLHEVAALGRLVAVSYTHL